MSGLQQDVHVAAEAEGPQQESVLQGQAAAAARPRQHQLHEIMSARGRELGGERADSGREGRFRERREECGKIKQIPESEET